MKQILKESHYLEWYIIANEVILGILSLFTLINEYLPTVLPDTNNVFASTGLYILSIIGFPILSFVSQMAPVLGDWQMRFIGVFVFWLYVVIAFVLFDLIRRFVVRLREKGLYSESSHQLFSWALWCVSVATAINFIGTFVINIMNRYLYPMQGTVVVIEYLLGAIESIPFVATLLVGGLWLLRKMYKDAIELKRDQDLTV